MNRRARLQSLLADGQLRQVIEELLRLTKQYPTLHAEAVALSARYRQYLREKHGNTTSSDELAVELNRIHGAALHLIGQLPEEAPLAWFRDWRKLAAAISAFIFFSAAVAELSGYSLRDLFSKKEATPVQQEEQTKVEDTEALQPAADSLPAEPGQTGPPPEDNRPKAASTAAALPKGDNRKTSPPPADTALTVTCKTDKGRDKLRYQAGEIMRLYFRASRPCHLRIIYRLADGRLVLFDDGRQLGAAEAGSYQEIGEGYEAYEPFGEETLYVFAQNAPFAPLQTRTDPDGYRFITEGLPEALEKTRGFKKKTRYAEDSLKIITYR